ncbi:hypothetical protein L1049_002074 [Liquidambar formosana]|uniref:S-adenosylmethionine-dependent methyltransferase n=1 Tax=Liquidambar formosana TaxID=63359 RepID=A0AAP0R971_LIQFO
MANEETKIMHESCTKSHPVNSSNESINQAQKMPNEETQILNESCLKSYAMNGGNGPYSYAQNSYYQRVVVDAAKVMLTETIADKLDIKNPTFDPSKPFLIADMGCSVGNNTFISVQNIIEAVELKYQSSMQKNPEFQVFFNDNTDNDFNTLFKSLPPTHQYFAAGVPGSFYGRLFPNSTLHIVHSSYALHWLSKVPKEVLDRNSLAWNGGRIMYTRSAKEVYEAYSAQYKEDMQAFLNARAQEFVGEGLMVLLVLCLPNGVLFSQTCSGWVHDLLGSCLVDMAKMGLLSEERVDSFNLPLYYTSPKELEEVIQTNGFFNIERMEKLTNPSRHGSVDLKMCSLHLRSAMEGLIREHFGNEIIEELFECFDNKLAENSFIFDDKNRKEIELFVFLRRNNAIV